MTKEEKAFYNQMKKIYVLPKNESEEDSELLNALLNGRYVDNLL